MNLIEFLKMDAERNRTEIRRKPKRSIDDPSVSELVKKAVSIAYEYAGENMDTEEMIDAFQELFSASPQDTSTTDGLKPCPFCGGKVGWDSGSIYCPKCNFSFRPSWDGMTCVRRWNRRTQ